MRVNSSIIIVFLSFLLACGVNKNAMKDTGKQPDQFVYLAAPCFAGTHKQFCLFKRNVDTGEWELYYDTLEGLEELEFGQVYHLLLREKETLTPESEGSKYSNFVEKVVAKQKLEESIEVVLQIDSQHSFVQYDSLGNPSILGKYNLNFADDRMSKAFEQYKKDGEFIRVVWDSTSTLKQDLLTIEKLLIGRPNQKDEEENFEKN